MVYNMCCLGYLLPEAILCFQGLSLAQAAAPTFLVKFLSETASLKHLTIC